MSDQSSKKNTSSGRDTNNPVDAHVGSRLRRRRTELGLSQGELGARVGLTYQQLQKYERALNRISSGRLWTFAMELGVSVHYFFEDMPEDVIQAFPQYAAKFDTSDEEEPNDQHHKQAVALMKAFRQMPNPVIRKRVIQMVLALNGDLDDTD